MKSFPSVPALPPLECEVQELVTSGKVIELNQRGKKNGDQAERSLVKDMKWIGSEPPPVSIEDRTVVGIVDQGLNCTNRIPGVGGSRNW